MVLNIAALVLTLAIIFLNSIYGLFSGLVNLFCVIAAAAVAFGFFEPLNDVLTKAELHPSYSEPVAFVGLFIITLLILRLLSDMLIRGNVRVPMSVDWGGGALCGFFIAQFSVGILVLGFLMLPFGGRVAMFSRTERTGDKELNGLARFEAGGLWLGQDRMAAGLANLLSAGSMKNTDTTLATVYPNFSEWVLWSGNTVQPESLTAPRRKGSDGFERGLRVESVWDVSGSLAGFYREEVPTERNKNPKYTERSYAPEAGHKLLGVRLALDASAADAHQNNMKHRFRPTMIRIVGKRGADPEQFYPVIIGNLDLGSGGASNRIVDPDNDFSLESGGTTLDVYFDVPTDFDPAFVEYRRHARAAMPGGVEEAAPAAAAPAAVAAAPGDQTPPGGAPVGGQTSFINTILTKETGDRDLTPFIFSAEAVQQGDVVLKGSKFASGRVSGLQSELGLKGLSKPMVNTFDFPAGKRLLQIRFRPKQALTLAGQVFNFAARMNQYRAKTTDGREYWLAGYFAFVPRGNERQFELYYQGDPDSAESIASPGMLDFKHINPSDLSTYDQSEMGLLFIVDPGVVIDRIENQTGAGYDLEDIQMRGG